MSMFASAAFLGLVAVGMGDMAWSNTVRHGFWYAIGEWLATLLLLACAVTSVLIGVGA